MSAKTKEEYFASGTTPVPEGSDVYSPVYRMNESKVLVRELEIDVGLDGEKIELAMLSDMHIRKERADIYAAVTNAMECASFSDQIILCGDNIECVSDDEHIRLFKETVLEPYPDTICVVGNHDQFYGDPAECRKKLDSVWPHDSYCHTKLLKEKLYIIAADDNTGVFSENVCERVAKELEFARKMGYPVLLFIHIGFNRLKMELGANQKMNDIIISYADTVKAVFAGHNHVDYHEDIAAYFIDKDGNRIEKAIPLYKLQANSEPDFTGNVLFLKIR